jgi:nucleotide-binding universal stress UspA family protein
MIRLKSVLVATDFGPTSDAALVYGRDLARAFGARLHVLHVVDATVVMSAAQFVPSHSSPIDGATDAARSELDALVTVNDRDHLGATTAVRVSPAIAKTIVAHAKDAHADIIVVGTHGRGPVSHLLMGSVAEKVVRTASCPVLVVPSTEREVVILDPVGAYAPI